MYLQIVGENYKSLELFIHLLTMEKETQKHLEDMKAKNMPQNMLKRINKQSTIYHNWTSTKNTRDHEKSTTLSGIKKRHKLKSGAGIAIRAYIWNQVEHKGSDTKHYEK